MKNLLVSLAFCLTSTSFASEIQGIVKKFTGTRVETGKPYSYIALQTIDGKRIKLPRWIDASKILETNAINTISFSAIVQPMACADMSAACMTDFLTSIRSAKIEFPTVSEKGLSTYSSRLEIFSGRAVETPTSYYYIAIYDQIRVEVPSFLNAAELVEKNAEVTVKGKIQSIFCTDMSPACGPAQLVQLRSVEILL